jgi:hypothetical protein
MSLGLERIRNDIPIVDPHAKGNGQLRQNYATPTLAPSGVSDVFTSTHPLFAQASLLVESDVVQPLPRQYVNKYNKRT